jgi:hypothetical protein
MFKKLTPILLLVLPLNTLAQRARRWDSNDEGGGLFLLVGAWGLFLLYGGFSTLFDKEEEIEPLISIGCIIGGAFFLYLAYILA